ncbi:MAG: Gfo/Idh/MocA family oxidoreductase [Chloroflexi bacterium]|nr:Gfo/Idh/MocA family oxidoreductase [Chloroflexota bacterium]
MPRPLTAVLIGAGNRGSEAYGSYALAHPEQIRFVAVAEPHEGRRARFAQAHGIPPEHQFTTWEDLLARGKIADAALVCTMDRMHVEPAVAALEAGYDVLLEKPMAPTLAGCVQLVQTAERTGHLLQIAHVLRYVPFFSMLHDVVASGRLGDIITVEHRENVSYWHMAHSFVRGLWRNSDIASPMILTKCCHDLDILFWLFGPCRRLSSFGSLIHYRAENAPSGAPERCTDGCPAADECPWYAPRIYLEQTPLKLSMPGLEAIADYQGWPVSVLSEDPSPEARRRALEAGPYGRCVYHCDNNVVDHQVVNMELEGGTSVSMIMHGHSHKEGRTMRYDGTRATLLGRYYLDEQWIEIHDHLTGRVERVEFPMASAGAGATGHASGDQGLMAAFVRAVNGTEPALTTARDSLESHLMAFAAEEARLNGSVIDMKEFRQRAEASTPPKG